MNGFDEVVVIDQHHEVDWIEVLLAMKAAPEVGSWVDGGHEFPALRTKEAKPPVALLAWPMEMGQKVFDGNLVAKLMEDVFGKVLAYE